MKLGVNIHPNYTDGAYNMPERVWSCLVRSRISLVRTAAPSLGMTGFSNYEYLLQKGLRWCFTASNVKAPGQVIADLKAVLAKYPGLLMEAIEGPNEVNNWPIDASLYPSFSRDDAAVKYQNDLCSAVKADPALKSVPVYSFTGGTKGFGTCDYRNDHTYSKTGGFTDIASKVAEMTARSTLPGGIVLTELGYDTNPDFIGWHKPVCEQDQMDLTANALRQCEAAGVYAAYLYQLLDDYWVNQGNKTGKDCFGLFDLGYRPKPVAEMIRAMG